MNGFHFDRIALGFERGFILSQVGAQALEPRQIRVAGHLARGAQALDIGNGFFQHAPLSFERLAAGILEGDFHLRFLRNGSQALFEVNGLPSIELKYHYPGIDSNLLTKIKEQEMATLHLSDAIVCPSNVTRDYLASLGLSPRRVTVIPNGVSPSDFCPSPLPSRAGRVPVLLYIGTLADWQGLDVVIRALPKILEQQAVRLHIVGRGRSRQRKLLSKQIRKLGLEGSVIVQPAVPHHQVAALIADSDICLAPLGLNDRNVTQGACPIKVLEYMASSRPLVASNMPIVRELVREDLDALLFSPNDPADLARQVLALLNDYELSKRLSESAAERALTQFTWHAAQKKLVKVYRKLLGG